MAKIQFRGDLHLNKANIRRLETINSIIEEYAKQGYRLTLRQLYYQLVSRDIIPNQQAEYAKLSNILVKGRMGGVVDWNAIEDRIRKAQLPYWAENIPDAINDIMQQYRLDRQRSQKNYIETWCEKDALSNVLYYVTAHYHINLIVNRGYTSCTAMYDAYERFYNHEEQEPYILYLGDHDPSGLDMLRDIENRLDEFGVNPEIIHVALTSQQIADYNPPPNPTKTTDPRANWYISQHGETCWEVDALKPEILHGLVKENIENLIDIDLFEKRIRQEKRDKKVLLKFAKRVGKN